MESRLRKDRPVSGVRHILFIMKHCRYRRHSITLMKEDMAKENNGETDLSALGSFSSLASDDLLPFNDHYDLLSLYMPGGRGGCYHAIVSTAIF